MFTILAIEPEFISILFLFLDNNEILPSNNAIVLEPSGLTSETHSVPLIDATAFGDLRDILTGILLVFDQILPNFKLMVCFCLGFFSKKV